MEPIKERLARVRKEKSMTQVQLGAAAGVSQGTIGNIESGIRGYGDSVVAIARALGESAEYMLCHTDARLLGQDHQSNVIPAPALGVSKVVPVRGQAKGGPDGFLEDMQYPPGYGEGFVETWVRDQHAYALRVTGDSMAPRYRAGEFIIVTPSIEPMPGMDVVVCLKDGRKMLKNLGWRRSDTIQLLSVNDAYPPTTLLLKDIDSIERVACGAGPDAFIEG